MAKKKNPVDRFRENLEVLSQSITEELCLSSLRQDQLQGFAYHFRIVLPLLDAKGDEVFTDSLLNELFKALDDRFRGCIVASSSSAPPLWGLWHPPQESQAEKDYLTTVEVLASPIDATNRFFTGLKPMLKKAGRIEQQEILITRTDCWLV